MNTTRQFTWKNPIISICIIALSLVLIFPDFAMAATGTNVETHTQTEIKNYIKSNGATVTDPITFEVTPVVTAPYLNGQLSSTTLQSSVNMLNQIRYIAGIDYDVTLDNTYTEKAQACTLLNAINQKLSHSPTKPDGMTDELYNLGYSGAQSSNIGSSSYGRTLNSTLVHGWMEDADSGNIPMVGHRRWTINPKMGKVGFGATGNYTAMYAFDSSRSSSYVGVAWPAQNMPIEYFGNDYPWSISMGTTVDISAVNVTLTRLSDNKVWTFSQANANGYFNVNNDGYGQKGCIIFRPDSVSYSAGDEFSVKITGTDTEVNYNVSFFNLSGGDIEDATVASIPDQVYQGKAITPNISVTHNGNTLVKDTDYTVAYKNNTNVGTATVTITGIGNYEGTVEKTFIIKKAPSLISLTKTFNKTYGDPAFNLSASLMSGDGELTYSSNTPSVATISPDGKIVLKAPGKAVITVNASETSNYLSATATATVKVKPAKVTGLKAKSKKSKKATISWKANANNSGYQILMATNKKFTKSKKIVNISKGSTAKKTVKKLKKKKTYFVKVRAYKVIDGQKVWGAYSGVKKVKIK